MVKDYDILVVGAGLVGTSLAVALQGQGLRIALLEKNLPQVISPQTSDTRPLSLAYASHTILKTLGVWSDLEAHACPIKTVHVSHEGAFGITRFKAAEMDVPALGYVVPFSLLQQSLYQHAVGAGATFLPVESIASIQCDADQASVTMQTAQGQQTLTADVLVAADGARSAVRELLGIESECQNRQEMALTAEIDLVAPHDHTAYERFTESGTFALLPLPDAKRYRLVWTMPADLSGEVKQWSDEALLSVVQDCFARRVGGMKSITRGASYPLQTVIAKEQTRPGFVLLGNAAHTIYPLAAQGFNLGLRDTAVLSEAFVSARQQVQPLGDPRVLKSYEAACKPHQDQIVRLTQGITDLFGLQLPFLKKARGLGLLATDLIPPLKCRFAKRSMGLAGRLPKLARGRALQS